MLPHIGGPKGGLANVQMVPNGLLLIAWAARQRLPTKPGDAPARAIFLKEWSPNGILCFARVIFKPTKNAWPRRRFGVPCPPHIEPMKKIFYTRGIAVIGLMLGLAIVPALFAEDKKEEKKEEKKVEAPKPKPQSVFKDKALEEGVRKFVFAKRYNKEPLLEADLIHLSTIKATNAGIKDLSGLEKCRALASLDLAGNEISDFSAIKDLKRIQYLNLAKNKIENIAPIAGLTALQYIELSNNRVKDLKPLEGLSNMRSLYLSNNRISDFSPALKLTKLWSLYLDHNQVAKLDGVDGLKGLTTLSAGNNDIADLSPLKGLTRLHFLFLENNKVANLTSLVEMAGADYKGPKNFAPFLRLYLKGNPIDGATDNRLQFARLMKYGVRVETPRQPELVTFDSTGWTGELTGEQLIAFQKDILDKFDLVKDARVKLQLKVSPEDGITKQEVDELKAALKKLGLSDKVDLSF
tara:strand:- start:79 stop:1476 length:1398 start_codon:yes stop_codon:yes gene_type:complete